MWCVVASARIEQKCRIRQTDGFPPNIERCTKSKKHLCILARSNKQSNFGSVSQKFSPRCLSLKATFNILFLWEEAKLNLTIFIQIYASLASPVWYINMKYKLSIDYFEKYRYRYGHYWKINIDIGHCWKYQ